MTEPTFGITFNRTDDEPRAVIASDLSTILIVGTAPAADGTLFPLDTAVLVRTSDSSLRASLGATGTIPDAMAGIAAQLGDFQAAADVIVIRVDEGANANETIANLIGSEEDMTGMWAALLAGPDLTRIPRLIIVPGYTHQRQTGLATITVTAGGSGYTTAPTVTLNGGGGGTATAVLGTGGDAGKVVSVTINDPGNYTSAPTVSFSGGGGTGATATATTDTFANPVCVALPALCSRLLAHAIVEGPGTNEIAIKDWREDLNSERLIPIDCWVKVQDGTSIVTRPGVSRIAGIAVRVDYENGGAPMHSWANQPIQGIVGLVRNPSFSLTDGDTEGQSLLASNIGIAVRGELGVESAAANSGFVFIGTDNSTDDPLWQFYHVTRGRDYIHLGLLRTLRIYLGRNNIDGHAVQSLLNTATIWLGDLQADDHILGFRVGFDSDKNNPENLRLGKFRFYFQAEEPPVLRRLEIDSMRYRPALEGLIQDLLSQTQPSTLVAEAA